MPKLQQDSTRQVLVISKCLEFLKGLRNEFRTNSTYQLRMVDTLQLAQQFKDRRYDIVVYHGDEPATLEWLGTVVKETRAKAIVISPATKMPVKFKIHIVPSGAKPEKLVETVSDLITTTKNKKGTLKAA